VFTALQAASERLRGTNVMLSAQDVFYEETGAYTGEISPLMLRDVGCEYAIIGHSERRQYFSETDETVNKKIKAALAAGVKAIFCIGESLEQREAGKTNDVLRGQLEGGLSGVGLEDIVVAYEPIWAIGTGVTATPEQAQDAHKFIRSRLADMYGEPKAGAVRILYGGSVKPENVKELMGRPDIDGALVGGASLKPESFVKLVKFRGQ
jgi:triosephosphate isomerase